MHFNIHVGKAKRVEKVAEISTYLSVTTTFRSRLQLVLILSNRRYHCRYCTVRQITSNQAFPSTDPRTQKQASACETEHLQQLVQMHHIIMPIHMNFCIALPLSYAHPIHNGRMIQGIRENGHWAFTAPLLTRNCTCDCCEDCRICSKSGRTQQTFLTQRSQISTKIPPDDLTLKTEYVHACSFY